MEKAEAMFTPRHAYDKRTACAYGNRIPYDHGELVFSP